jgi:hypothetical protein
MNSHESYEQKSYDLCIDICIYFRYADGPKFWEMH